MDTSLAYFLYRFAWGSLDLIFPPICGGCGQLGRRWCRDCQSKVQHLVEPVCDVCGISVSEGVFVRTVSGCVHDIASSAPGRRLMIPFAVRCINLNIVGIWRWEMHLPHNCWIFLQV